MFKPQIVVLLLLVALFGFAGKACAGKEVVRIKVYANNTEMTATKILPLRIGQSINLKVELVYSDGSLADVTKDVGTRYFSIAPWILSVTDTGTVLASTSDKYHIPFKSGDRDLGGIMISNSTAGSAHTVAIMVEVQSAEQTTSLDVSASHTTLHIGESVQLIVARKTEAGTEPLQHPEQTKYITTWESMAVVEPDGKVTAIGTSGKPEETATVMAFNGKLEGSVSFSLHADGPGPSLDFIAEGPATTDTHAAACCSPPIQLVEGQQVRFRVLRRDVQHTDVTRNAGTRYTLFFGSGVPNDPNAAKIVGYGEGINPDTFRLDEEQGMIIAPPTIGRLNHFTVLVFVRNGDAVGWKQFQLVHTTRSPGPSDIK